MKATKYFPFLTGVFVLVIYIFTLAPSVIQIDSGELTTVQIIAGIAHPTGYPLFTMIGYLWSLVPFPLRDIVQMNLLAAIYCAAAAGLFVRISLMVINARDNFGKIKEIKKKKRKKEVIEKPAIVPGTAALLAAVSGALMLAFSKTFWFQSTSVEVYSLHILLIMVIINFLILAYLKGGDKITDKYWLLFALSLALGFSNHMTTMLILPGTAYLYFLKYKFNKRSLQRLAVMISMFAVLLGLSYAYLPLRTSYNPLMNWGNPVDMERIIRHILGKQYQVWLFSSTESAKKQLLLFINNIPSEFYFSLAVAAAGIIISFNYIRRFSVFLLISFLSTVLYSINYDIADIDSYFLLAYISLGFFAVIAVVKTLIYFYPEGKGGYKTAVFALGLLITLQVYFNFSKVDQSGNYAYEDYTKSILNSVPQNALILSYQWDYFISPAIYFQLVEKFRKDVVVIDKELLRRSWYFNQIETNYPAVLNGLKNDITLFLEALKPFERDEQYDAGLLENLYRRIMTGIISTNIDKRDIYIAPEIVENEMQRGEFILPEGYTIVPDRFLFKVTRGSAYVSSKDPDFSIRFPGHKNQYIAFIERVTGSMLVRRAMYEMQFDKKEKAALYLNKIIKELPGYPIPPELLAAIK